MVDYDWSRKSTGEKIFMWSFAVGFLAIFTYGYLAITAHRWIIWNDINWGFAWQLLKSLGILALFPLIVLPVAFLLKRNLAWTVYPEHRFFQDWASIFYRYGKGGGRRAAFFVEEVEVLNLQQAFFHQESVYLARVRFKRKWTFRRDDVRFILRISDKAGLKPFWDWAMANRIAVSLESEEQNQRRS